MIQQSHIRKFHVCKKYMPSDKDIKKLRANIYKYIPILHSMFSNSNSNNSEDLSSTIHKFMISTLEKFVENGYMNSKLYELQAMKTILNNPSIIAKKYNNIQNRKFSDTIYTSDMARTQNCVLINALEDLNADLELAAKNNITLTSNSKLFVDRNKFNRLPKYYENFYIKLLKSNNIQEQLSIVLEGEAKECENFIKQNTKNSLSNIYKFFTQFDLLGSYISSYNRTSNKFDFQNLDYNLFNDNIQGDVSLVETFSDDFLDSLSIEDLCFLTTFWYNRLAKECDMINLVFSSIDSLDLWKNVLNNDTKFELSDKSLIASLRKFNYINQLWTDSFLIYHNNITSAELKNGISGRDTVRNDFSGYYSQLHNYINDDYCNFFDEFLPNNCFNNDASLLLPLINLKLFAYKQKEGFLEPIIQNSLTYNRYKNWGIIIDEIDNDRKLF